MSDFVSLLDSPHLTFTDERELLRKVVANQWYWDNNGVWTPYDVHTNAAIQNSYARKCSDHKFTTPSGSYKLIFSARMQLNELSNVARSVKCDDPENREAIKLVHGQSVHHNELSTSSKKTRKRSTGSPESPGEIGSIGIRKSGGDGPGTAKQPSGANQWYWEDDDDWVPYDVYTNAAIQKAYSSADSHYNLTCPSGSFKISFKKKVQKNTMTGKERRIKCDDPKNKAPIQLVFKASSNSPMRTSATATTTTTSSLSGSTKQQQPGTTPSCSNIMLPTLPIEEL